MGVSIYVTLENPLPEFYVPHIDGKALARALPDTDDGSLLAPLVQFVSLTEDQIAAFMEELDEADLPPGAPDATENWFEPSQALPLIENILQALKHSTPSEITSGVIDDLENVERSVQKAQMQKTRFHLTYDL